MVNIFVHLKDPLNKVFWTKGFNDYGRSSPLKINNDFVYASAIKELLLIYIPNKLGLSKPHHGVFNEKI